MIDVESYIGFDRYVLASDTPIPALLTLRWARIRVYVNGPTGVDPEDYEFRLHVPVDTGINIGNTLYHRKSRCDYSVSPPYEDSDYRTVWRKPLKHIGEGGLSAVFNLVRCRVGDGLSAITLESRHESTGTSVPHNFVGWTVSQARHQRDNTVAYVVKTSDSDVANAARLAADAWNYPGTAVKFCYKGLDAANNPVDECNGENTDGHVMDVKLTNDLNTCPNMACWKPVGSAPHPHIGGMEVFLEDPPRIDPETYFQWTDDKKHHNKEVNGRDGVRFLYYTAVMTHEFGHAGGLAHSRVEPDLMRSVFEDELTRNDERAMEANHDHDH